MDTGSPLDLKATQKKPAQRDAQRAFLWLVFLQQAYSATCAAVIWILNC